MTSKKTKTKPVTKTPKDQEEKVTKQEETPTPIEIVPTEEEALTETPEEASQEEAVNVDVLTVAETVLKNQTKKQPEKLKHVYTAMNDLVIERY